MGDLALLVALLLGAAGVVLSFVLRTRPATVPRCLACDLEMEFVSDMIDPIITSTRYAVGAGVRGEGPDSFVRLFHCPRCGRRRVMR